MSEAEPGLWVAALWLYRPEWSVIPELGLKALSVVKATPGGAWSWQQDPERGDGLSSQSPTAAVCGLPQMCASRLVVSWRPALLADAWLRTAAVEKYQDVLFNGPFVKSVPDFNEFLLKRELVLGCKIWLFWCCCLTFSVRCLFHSKINTLLSYYNQYSYCLPLTLTSSSFLSVPLNPTHLYFQSQFSSLITLKLCEIFLFATWFQGCSQTLLWKSQFSLLKHTHTPHQVGDLWCLWDILCVTCSQEPKSHPPAPPEFSLFPSQS